MLFDIGEAFVIDSVPTFTNTDPDVAKNDADGMNPVEYAPNDAFSFVKLADICDSDITGDIAI